MHNLEEKKVHTHTSQYTLTSVVKCCIKMLIATIVLFAWMTFRLAGVDVCCWYCCCRFRAILSGTGDAIDNSVLWSPLQLWLPSIESAIENSIKFSVKSPFVRVLSLDFDFDLDFDLTLGMATALLAAGAASDTRPLRWMDAIGGWCCWWWSSLSAAAAAVADATVAADANFFGFVPLFVLWLLLLMLLLLLFMIGGWDSVESRPCSKGKREKRKKEQCVRIFLV